MTPEPAATCGSDCCGMPKKRRKNGSRRSGFSCSGLFCSTAMFTTAGVTFSRIGASVGRPSRIGRPVDWAWAAQESPTSRQNASELFVRLILVVPESAYFGGHADILAAARDELLAVPERLASHPGLRSHGESSA